MIHTNVQDMNDWTQLTHMYVTQMRAVRRSEGTIRLHRQYLTVLARLHPDPLTVTTWDLTVALANRAWGPDAAKSARSVWRGFYRWCHGMGLMDTWIAESLPAVKMPVRVPRPADELTCERALRDPNTRMRLLAMLGVWCGLRAGEMAVVHRDDYDAARRVLLVHGKGNKERLVPVPRDELHDLICKADGWLFPSQVSGKHLTSGHVTKLLSDALGRYTAHNLRHSYGTTILDKTGDLMAARDLMGHASVATTQGYTRTSVERLWAAATAAGGSGARRAPGEAVA